MDWSNERYVRLYTRDTDSWLVLSWQARALLTFLLRKVDRAGVLETKRGALGVAAAVGMPLDEVQRALPELLTDGCVTEHGRGYVIPNFLAAQEAIQSDKQRSKEYRQRRRDKAVAPAGRAVTNGDASVTWRDASVQTDRGAVTPRDATVTSVTNRVTPSDPDQTNLPSAPVRDVSVSGDPEAEPGDSRATCAPGDAARAYRDVAALIANEGK